MKEGKKPIIKWLLLAAVPSAFLVLLAGHRLLKLREYSRSLDLSRYDYRDTRQLVSLTARAAELIARSGKKAFADRYDGNDAADAVLVGKPDGMRGVVSGSTNRGQKNQQGGAERPADNEFGLACHL